MDNADKLKKCQMLILDQLFTGVEFTVCVFIFNAFLPQCTRFLSNLIKNKKIYKVECFRDGSLDTLRY